MVRPTFSSGIATERTSLPEKYVVTEAYPNPFVDHLTLTFKTTNTEHVRASIFDALGREVEMIVSRVVTAKTRQQFEVDLSDLPPGTYFYKVIGETFEVSRSITRIN